MLKKNQTPTPSQTMLKTKMYPLISNAKNCQLTPKKEKITVQTLEKVLVTDKIDRH
jgi:hypothetical protein